MFIHLSTILLFLLQIVKGRLSLGHLLEKWDLEVLKKNTPYAAQMAAQGLC